MKYAVIRVDQDYDYVEGAECLAAFDTEYEASALITKIKAEQTAATRRRLDYVEQFVDKIVLPEPPEYNGWLEFLKIYFGEAGRYVYPKDFHMSLKRYLMEYSPTIEGYDPPKREPVWHNLFVVEIK
jgi:hypothetical protein